jgi:hypothetical protein
MEEDQLDSSTLGDDTLDDSNNTALQDNDGHADSATVDKPGTSLPNQEHDELTRLRKKVSKIERENAETRKPKELDQATLAELDEKFRGNPAKYESWRQSFAANGGKDYGSYDEVYGTPGTAQHVQNVPTKGVTKEDVWGAVDFVTDVKGFLREYPEFDASLATDEDDAEQKQIELKFIMDTAASKMALAKRQGKPLSKDQARAQALVAFDPDKYTEQVRTSARLAGRQDAYAKGAGTTFGSSAGGTKSQGLGLSDEDRQVARALGITEDEMLAQKKKSKSSRRDLAEE